MNTEEQVVMNAFITRKINSLVTPTMDDYDAGVFDGKKQLLIDLIGLVCHSEDKLIHLKAIVDKEAI